MHQLKAPAGSQSVVRLEEPRLVRPSVTEPRQASLFFGRGQLSSILPSTQTRSSLRIHTQQAIIIGLYGLVHRPATKLRPRHLTPHSNKSSGRAKKTRKH
jgi:hypothetical protein